MTALPCAKCKGTLVPYTTTGVIIDRCTSCHGLFFNKGELSQILSDSNLASVSGEDAQHAATAPHAAADAAPALCPICRIPMGRLEAGTGEGFAYDICPSCNALWLDAGELAFLEKAHAASQAKADPDAGKRHAAEVTAGIEKQLEFIDKQKRQRLARLDKMMQHGLSDTAEILSIQQAIDAEAEVTRRAIAGSRLFAEAKRLAQEGALESKEFERVRQRLGVRE